MPSFYVYETMKLKLIYFYDVFFNIAVVLLAGRPRPILCTMCLYYTRFLFKICQSILFMTFVFMTPLVTFLTIEHRLDSFCSFPQTPYPAETQPKHFFALQSFTRHHLFFLNHLWPTSKPVVSYIVLLPCQQCCCLNSHCLLG